MIDDDGNDDITRARRNQARKDVWITVFFAVVVMTAVCATSVLMRLGCR